ncbi:PAS domain S-box protein [Pedobacter immunditicola]|uniref:PAS domain S-box protein n=1 Tax=Pedobacter immunditicola TaxID=3133440 RepID=UPI0030B4B9A7
MNISTALNNIIAVTPIPLAIVDTNMNYIAVSEQWISLFQLKNQAIIGLSHLTAFPDLQPHQKVLLEDCLKGKNETIEKSKHARADGLVLWLKWEIRNWVSDDGCIGGLLLYCEDISSSCKDQQLKEHLFQSETQFNQAFDHSLIGMSIISPEGHWKRINQSLTQMLGYTEEELIGRHVKEITHTDDIADNNNSLKALAVGNVDKIRVEKRYIHKNGSVIWVVVAATMLNDSEGNPLHFISQIEDITQRKEDQEKLIRSEKKYRSIFENVQEVFYQLDEQGSITEISPLIEKYSGYSRSSLLNRPASDFYAYPEDRDKILSSLHEHGVVSDFEVRLRTKEEKVVYVSVNARVVMEDGIFKGIEGSMRDITIRKLQEDALKALNLELTVSNELKNELLSIIGHDLRNPISGSLQLLNLTLMDFKSNTAEELHMYLLQMKLELSNANNLLEDLLAWAKIQFKSINMNPVDITDVASHVQKAILTIQPLAEKKNIDVSLEIDEALNLYADAGMLDAIIRNLLTNAIKFTKDGGRVLIKASNEEKGVKFSVTDNGVGMSKEQMNKLFDRNQNYTTYGTSGEKGTGLGFNLCHDFALKHGGDLWVESTPGLGSTFHFTIPLQKP